MTQRVNQSLVHKAVILQSAAQSKERERLQSMSKLLDPLDAKTRPGGVFIPERAQAASSFEKFSMSGEIQSRFAQLMRGSK